MRVGSLFAGIGGFDLAAEAVGWEVVWQAEINAACSQWLAEHFPGVPNLGDVSKVDWSQVERPNVLCGGFPCQPHSVAGKKKGKHDERDLWPEIVRCVRVLRPDYCVFENVPGLLTTGGGRFFAGILGDLAALGYDAEWVHISAESIGAPHGRDRVWIVAYADGVGGERRRGFGELARAGREAQGEARERKRRRNALDRGRAGLRGVGQADTDHAGRGEQRGAESVRSEHAAVEHGGRGVGDADGAGPLSTALPGVHRGEEGRWPRDAELERRSGAMEYPSSESAGEPDTGIHTIASRRDTRGEPLSPSSRIRGWGDAVIVRGADGTLRRIPRAAAEEAWAQSAIRPLDDGIPAVVAGFDPAEESLWPVAISTPGRVARLSAVGNALSPHIPAFIFRAIQAHEAEVRVAA